MSSEPENKKSIRLCLYLIKAECTDPFKAIKNGHKALDEFISVGKTKIHLVLLKNKPSKPDWLTFFDSYRINSFRDLLNVSNSLLLLLTVNDRIFAVTFGYGKHLIDPNLIEDNFGLKFVLNTLEPKKIRSVDLKNLDVLLRQSRVQASKSSSIENFGLNFDQDILNAATGDSDNAIFGKRIAGSAAAYFSIKSKIENIPSLCSAVLAQSQLQIYKRRGFAWVDKIGEVKSQVLVDKLYAVLIQQIIDGKTEKIFLAPPEVLEWETIKGFKVGGKDDLYEDIDYGLLAESFRNEITSIDQLKRKIISCWDNNDNFVTEWTALKCINFDLKLDGEIYILTNQKWYRVNAGFASKINSEIADIPEVKIKGFPEFDPVAETENSYNSRIYPLIKGAALCDCKMITIPGTNHPTEFCDIYDGKNIIHVKRFRGSSTLSHLFFQAHNSAFLLINDKDYKKEINNILPKSLRFNSSDQIQPSSYTIVFGIITNSADSIHNVFPFFSKISLRHTARQLKTYGYKVGVLKIPAKTV